MMPEVYTHTHTQAMDEQWSLRGVSKDAKEGISREIAIRTMKIMVI